MLRYVCAFLIVPRMSFSVTIIGLCARDKNNVLSTMHDAPILCLKRKGILPSPHVTMVLIERPDYQQCHCTIPPQQGLAMCPLNFVTIRYL